jgi:hypothetical protein
MFVSYNFCSLERILVFTSIIWNAKALQNGELVWKFSIICDGFMAYGLWLSYFVPSFILSLTHILENHSKQQIT